MSYSQRTAFPGPWSGRKQGASTPGKPAAVGPKAVQRGGSPGAAAPSQTGSAGGSPAPAGPSNDGDPSDNLLLEAKRLRTAPVTFRETNVLSERGIWKLYEAFQSLPLSGAPGREASDMAQVAALYNDWARQLAPQLHPTDVLTKCSEWSGKAVMRSTLQRIRAELEVPRSSGLAATLDGYRSLTAETLKLAEAEAARRKEAAKQNKSERIDGADGARGGAREDGSSGSEGEARMGDDELEDALAYLREGPAVELGNHGDDLPAASGTSGSGAASSLPRREPLLHNNGAGAAAAAAPELPSGDSDDDEPSAASGDSDDDEGGSSSAGQRSSPAGARRRPERSAAAAAGRRPQQHGEASASSRPGRGTQQWQQPTAARSARRGASSSSGGSSQGSSSGDGRRTRGGSPAPLPAAALMPDASAAAEDAEGGGISSQKGLGRRLSRRAAATSPATGSPALSVASGAPAEAEAAPGARPKPAPRMVLDDDDDEA